MTRTRKTRSARAWPPAPPGLVRSFDEAVRSWRGTERREMFGYPAIFVHGNMFAGLVRTKMILRLREADKENFLKLPGAKPFIAMSGRAMKQWVVVPPAVMKAPAKLQTWLDRALAHGRSLPPKTKQSRRKPRRSA